MTHHHIMHLYKYLAGNSLSGMNKQMENVFANPGITDVLNKSLKNTE